MTVSFDVQYFSLHSTDPITISTRQLDEMHRLMRERIAPADDPISACRADTAAKVDKDGRVNTGESFRQTADPPNFTYESPTASKIAYSSLRRLLRV